MPLMENWEREGNGEWCHGKVSFVYRKKPREAQKYRILYDDGTSRIPHGGGKTLRQSLILAT
jgi:hypothetical protein